MRRFVRRKTRRLDPFDYGSQGAYFVTICTHERRGLFGEICAGTMRLNAAGLFVLEAWRSIPERFPGVEIDEAAIVMPNHVHGIVWIVERNGCRGEVHSPSPRPTPSASVSSETQGEWTSPLQQKPTLGSVIAFFKYRCAKNINMCASTQIGKIWQRNYYDRIIRNDKELRNIRAYILNNPSAWETDQYH